AEVQLESFSVGADFFYKLFDETEWISSRHLDMATFLIRKKATLSSVGIWNSLDNGTSLLV
ncbi:PREDICTED: LOC109948410, partial [Prunus dulcis]